MAGGWSHKISYIFGANDHMATKNADFKRLRAVLEKRDVVLHLKIADCERRHGRCHSGVGDDGFFCCYFCCCFVL